MASYSWNSIFGLDPRRLSAFRGLHPWHWRFVPLVPLLVALVAITVISAAHAGWLLIPLPFLFWRTCLWRWRPLHPAGRGGPGPWI